MSLPLRQYPDRDTPHSPSESQEPVEVTSVTSKQQPTSTTRRTVYSDPGNPFTLENGSAAQRRASSAWCSDPSNPFTLENGSAAQRRASSDKPLPILPAEGIRARSIAVSNERRLRYQSAGGGEATGKTASPGTPPPTSFWRRGTPPPMSFWGGTPPPMSFWGGTPPPMSFWGGTPPPTSFWQGEGGASYYSFYEEVLKEYLEEE